MKDVAERIGRNFDGSFIDGESPSAPTIFRRNTYSDAIANGLICKFPKWR